MPPALRLLYGLKNHPSNSDILVWKAFLRSVGNNTIESVKVAGNELAMIEYTGGSTGTPYTGDVLGQPTWCGAVKEDEATSASE